MLAEVARTTAAHGIPAVLDCNTRDEVLEAYGYGFRLFAHPVRDVVLSEQDWADLAGARFVSTLSGLRPLILRSDEFMVEYGHVGYAETQDPQNLVLAAKLDEPWGVQFGRQETRLAALAVMRRNCLSALERGALLVGTDAGNLGAFHGYSLMREIDQLAGAYELTVEQQHQLRHAATVAGARFFDDLAGRPDAPAPIAVGQPATFNLLQSAQAGRPLATDAELTVVDGVGVDRGAIVREIEALRSSDGAGKLVL